MQAGVKRIVFLDWWPGTSSPEREWVLPQYRALVEAFVKDSGGAFVRLELPEEQQSERTARQRARRRELDVLREGLGGNGPSRPVPTVAGPTGPHTAQRRSHRLPPTGLHQREFGGGVSLLPSNARRRSVRSRSRRSAPRSTGLRRPVSLRPSSLRTAVPAQASALGHPGHGSRHRPRLPAQQA